MIKSNDESLDNRQKNDKMRFIFIDQILSKIIGLHENVAGQRIAQH